MKLSWSIFFLTEHCHHHLRCVQGEMATEEEVETTETQHHLTDLREFEEYTVWVSAFNRWWSLLMTVLHPDPVGSGIFFAGSRIICFESGSSKNERADN